MDQERKKLQDLLLTFAPHVYFQPPEKTELQYPCIVYRRDYAATRFANDHPYSNRTRYLVTVIDPDADGAIRRQVAAMPLTTYNRFFTTSDLNHDVFYVYL